MFLVDTARKQLTDLQGKFQGMPGWQKAAISVAAVAVTYTVFTRLRNRKKQKVDYYANVPHLKAKKVVSCQNELGECCVWDDRKQLLCWIDCAGKKFWTYDPVTAQSNSYDLPEEAGSFALCEDGCILFAFYSGPAFYDVHSGKLGKKLFDFEPTKRTRMNDGRCDRFGRFVVGGVIHPYKGASNPLSKFTQFVKNMLLFFGGGGMSAIYRLNEDLSHQRLVTGIMCTNSICFSLDGKTMYFIDSFKHGIKQMDYYQNRRIGSDIALFSDRYSGYADGSLVDANGNVWNANFGEGKVACFDMNGDIIMVVDVPEKCVTCCCFGGRELDTLFITTLDGSKMGLPPPPLEDNEVGNLYAVQIPNVKGSKESRFKGRWQE